VNPKLNAMVADRFAAARAEAAAADLELAAARRAGAAALAALAAAKPFCGVPCVLKECFEVPGMPNSAGLVARVGVVGAGAASSWGPGGSKDPLRLGKVP
jgi:fatty acid amide hydrolase 2